MAIQNKTRTNQNQTANYYVYLLFDWLDVPRYVGKGKDNRWLKHEKTSDTINLRKQEFIDMTIAVLGEVPKVKVWENLTEKTALRLERTLIHVIGRFPNGPLTNMTILGGATAESAKRWWSGLSNEKRRQHAKTVSISKVEEWRNKTPEEMELVRARVSADMKSYYKNRSEEQRIAKSKACKKSATRFYALGRRVWVTDGLVNKRVLETDIIPKGWYRGRILPNASKSASKGWSKVLPEDRSARARKSSSKYDSSENARLGWVTPLPI
jgi:hypothetical protein